MLIHAEDDPHKARVIERIAKRVRPDLIYSLHLTTFEIGEKLAISDYHGPTFVITDWNLPGGGERAVEACRIHGIPHVVISSQDPPDGFVDTYPETPWLIFAGLGLIEPLSKILSVVSTRGTAPTARNQ
jgi:hypothetical protein